MQRIPRNCILYIAFGLFTLSACNSQKRTQAETNLIGTSGADEGTRPIEIVLVMPESSADIAPATDVPTTIVPGEPVIDSALTASVPPPLVPTFLPPIPIGAIDDVDDRHHSDDDDAQEHDRKFKREFSCDRKVEISRP